MLYQMLGEPKTLTYLGPTKPARLQALDLPNIVLSQDRPAIALAKAVSAFLNLIGFVNSSNAGEQVIGANARRGVARMTGEDRRIVEGDTELAPEYNASKPNIDVLAISSETNFRVAVLVASALVYPAAVFIHKIVG